MILGAEIALLILGLIGLCSGKWRVGKGLTVQGRPARIAGLIAIIPLPAAILLGVIAANGAFGNDIGWLWMVELGLVAACLIAATIVIQPHAKALKAQAAAVPAA